mmetsp:Transcript_30962/g.72102  ORF Transcript_30962/g.72102 Transcript_30962/m.72102 type:complete len:375 (-) Transcript_30962:764-1888(-)
MGEWVALGGDWGMPVGSDPGVDAGPRSLRPLRDAELLKGPLRMLDSGSCWRMGRVMVKTVPDATVLEQLIDPLWPSTSILTSGSPNPERPTSFAVSVLSVAGPVKICVIFSCGIPDPVSDTLIATSLAETLQPDTQTRPSLVNWSAFPIRLTRHCSILLLSPSIKGRSSGTLFSRQIPDLTSGDMASTAFSATSRSETSSVLRLMLPPLKLAASRMSPTTCASLLQEDLITRSLSWTAWGAVSSSTSAPASPMMPLSGVRSSCATAVKKASLALCASTSCMLVSLCALMSASLTSRAGLSVTGSLHAMKVIRCQICLPSSVLLFFFLLICKGWEVWNMSSTLSCIFTLSSSLSHTQESSSSSRPISWGVFPAPK